MRPPRDPEQRPHLHLTKLGPFTLVRVHWGEQWYGPWVRRSKDKTALVALQKLLEIKVWRAKVLRGF